MSHAIATPRLIGGLWCQEVLERLPDVLDGALEGASLAAVREHVGGCDQCARFGEAYATTVRLLRADPADPVPEDARARLRERLRRLG